MAWARGLTGDEDCAWCVMLASRGAKYKSKDTARGDVLRKGPGGMAFRYHDNCDCVPIPVFSSADWPGLEDAKALYALWQESTKGFKQLDAINAFRRELYRKNKVGEPLIPNRVRMRDAA